MQDLRFTFNAFIALAQVATGLLLLAAAETTAIDIIGGVVLAVGVVSLLGPLLIRFGTSHGLALPHRTAGGPASHAAPRRFDDDDDWL